MSEKRRGMIFGDWWHEALASRESGRAKALRSRLRRADNEVAVLAEPESQELARRLGLAAHQRWKVQAFCATIRVLSHVETDSDKSAAQLFGATKGKGTEIKRSLSTLRFQRIVRSANATEAATSIIRALPLIGRACHVGKLGQDLFYWSEPVRNRWCFDYFEGTGLHNESNEERSMT